MASEEFGPGPHALTMHQPWASLLVHGIKRIEGRPWPTNFRGRLWIHAASKQPSEQTIKEQEEAFSDVWQLEGVKPSFPKHYPTSALLGCVDIVDCLKVEAIEAWSELPESVRSEVGSPFGFLCEKPHYLVIPQQMSGSQKIWELGKKTAAKYEPALKKAAQIGTKSWSWNDFTMPEGLRDRNFRRSALRHKFQNQYGDSIARTESPNMEKRSGKSSKSRSSENLTHKGDAGFWPSLLPNSREPSPARSEQKSEPSKIFAPANENFWTKRMKAEETANFGGVNSKTDDLLNKSNKTEKSDEFLNPKPETTQIQAPLSPETSKEKSMGEPCFRKNESSGSMIDPYSIFSVGQNSPQSSNFSPESQPANLGPPPIRILSQPLKSVPRPPEPILSQNVPSSSPPIPQFLRVPLQPISPLEKSTSPKASLQSAKTPDPVQNGVKIGNSPVQFEPKIGQPSEHSSARIESISATYPVNGEIHSSRSIMNGGNVSSMDPVKTENFAVPPLPISINQNYSAPIPLVTGNTIPLPPPRWTVFRPKNVPKASAPIHKNTPPGFPVPKWSPFRPATEIFKQENSQVSQNSKSEKLEPSPKNSNLQLSPDAKHFVPRQMDLIAMKQKQAASRNQNNSPTFLGTSSLFSSVSQKPENLSSSPKKEPNFSPRLPSV